MLPRAAARRRRKSARRGLQQANVGLDVPNELLRSVRERRLTSAAGRAAPRGRSPSPRRCRCRCRFRPSCGPRRAVGGTASLAAAASAARRRCASSKIRITSPRRPGLASSAGGDGGAAGEASSEMLRLGGNRMSKRESSVAPAGIVARSTLPSGAVKAASEPGPMPGGTRTRTWPGGTGCSPMWTCRAYSTSSSAVRLGSSVRRRRSSATATSRDASSARARSSRCRSSAAARGATPQGPASDLRHRPPRRRWCPPASGAAPLQSSKR